MDDDALVRYAEQSLTRPPDFGYYGWRDMFRTWGFTPVGQNRDSGVRDRSNYRRILEDMRKMFPDEDMGFHVLDWVSDFRASDWAYGWQEHIIVRVLYDPDDDITPANITAVFRWVTETALYLREQYPSYDDYDLSSLEYEEARKSFETEWAWMLRRWDDADGPEPSGRERDHIWSAYDLMYTDSRNDADTLEEHVLFERAERIKAAKRITYRLLGKP